MEYRLLDSSSVESDGLDRNVAMYLRGLNLDNYLPKFREHFIDFDLFLSLSNTDLLCIGVENEQDRKTFLKGTRSKSSENDKYKEPLTYEEVEAILCNMYKYLNVLKMCLRSYDVLKVKYKVPNTAIDLEYAASEGIIIFSNAALDCISELRQQCLDLLPEIERSKVKKKSNSKRSKVTYFFLATSVITLASGLFLLKKSKI